MRSVYSIVGHGEPPFSSCYLLQVGSQSHFNGSERERSAARLSARIPLLYYQICLLNH